MAQLDPTYLDRVVEQDLTREIYALFGLAYFYTDCLHRGLCNVYSLHGFDAPGQILAPRIEEKLRFASDQPLGEVITRLRAAGWPGAAATDTERRLDASLGEAQQRRNYLAHRFYWDRSADWFRFDAMRDMAEFLSREVNFFFDLQQLTEDVVRSRASVLGIRSELDGGVEAMLTTPVEPEPYPTRRVPRKREQIIRAWQSKDGTTASLALESADGEMWQLCESGLTWCYSRPGEEGWVACELIERWLPAAVDARPSVATPWTYRMYFSTGALLDVWPGSERSTFRWRIDAKDVRRPKS